MSVRLRMIFKLRVSESGGVSIRKHGEIVNLSKSYPVSEAGGWFMRHIINLVNI